MHHLSSLINLTYFDARHCDLVHSIPSQWTELRVLLLGFTAFAEADTGVLLSMTSLTELDVRKCRILKRCVVV